MSKAFYRKKLISPDTGGTSGKKKVTETERALFDVRWNNDRI
jgi:hypothetical protein